MAVLTEIDDAFNNQLQAAAIVDATQIAWPNVVFVPTKGTPYLKPEKAGRARMPLGYGADAVQQWTGVWQVGVYVPRDSGEHEQARLAGAVMDAFPRGLTLTTPSGLRILVSHTSAPLPVPVGDWSSLPVQINWFATEPPPPEA